MRWNCFGSVKKKKNKHDVSSQHVRIEPKEILKLPTYHQRDQKQVDLINSVSTDKIHIYLDLSSCEFSYEDLKYYLHFCKMAKDRYKNRLGKLVIYCPKGLNKLFTTALLALTNRRTTAKIELLDDATLVPPCRPGSPAHLAKPFLLLGVLWAVIAKHGLRK